MTKEDKIAFKNRLKQIGLEIIGERIAMAKKAIDSAQESANSEEKSSAGDKYETARAMGHLEKDMHSRQMAEHVKELALLREIATDGIYESCRAGALVKCTDNYFFIAAGLGKQIVNGEQIFFLSPHAPLSKLLKNKKAGDKFLFNGKDMLIVDVG